MHSSSKSVNALKTALRAHLKTTVASNMTRMIEQTYSLQALTSQFGTWADDEWNNFFTPDVLEAAKLNTYSLQYCRLISTQWRMDRNLITKEITEMISDPEMNCNIYMLHQYHVLWQKSEPKKCVLCHAFGIHDLRDPDILKEHFARIRFQIPTPYGLVEPERSALSLSNGAGSPDNMEV